METNNIPAKPPYAMIAILFVGAFIAFLNNTLLNVALPSIMIEFSVKASQVQWLTTGYMLVNGILIPASAFFVQKFTNRRLFITAMILFSLGTALAIVAPSFWVLVAARMIQASGSAMMMPLLMNIILVSFPIEKRGTALGFFGLVIFTAPAIGPPLSGFIIENYDWRMLFVIILPIALLTLLYAIFKLRNIMEVRDIRVDLFSLLLSTIGFGGLLYGFSSVSDYGWTSPLVYGTIIIGATTLVMFVIRQLSLDAPMLDFKIYQYPMFTLASIISVVMSVSMFSGMILTPLYVQTIRGIAPLESGLLMLPGALLMGLMSPITGRLFDKYGAKALALTGLTITVVSTFYLSKLDMDSTYYYIMFIYTVRMFGISMVNMPIMTNGLNQLPMKSNPHGTAMNNTLQQVSGAIGTAVLLTIMTARMESTGARLMEKAETQGVIPSGGGALDAFLLTIEMDSMLAGIQFSFLVAAALAAVALVLALFIKRVIPERQ